MGKIICSACNTEYPDEFEECPLCGHREPGRVVPEIQPKVTADTEDAPKPKRAKWPWVVLTCLLAAIVLAGGCFIIYNIGFFWTPLSTMNTVRQYVPSFTSAAPQEPAPEETIQPEQYTNEEDQTDEPLDIPVVAEVVPCESLKLGSTTVTFEEAEQFYNMTVQKEPADCTDEVSFVSLEPSIATVNDNGKIVAISGGSTDVIVTCGSVTVKCLVTCDFSLAAGEEPLPMKLNNEDMTFFTLGEQFALEVENLPDNAAVTYTSSRPAVAEVSEKGVVTAKGIGSSTITAEIGDTKLTCIVRCNLDSVAETAAAEDPNCKISHSDVTMTVNGEYFKLFLKDSGGKKVSNITWKTSDSNVCTVDASGNVKAVGRGTATVSTIYGGSTYQCIVRCNLG